MMEGGNERTREQGTPVDMESPGILKRGQLPWILFFVFASFFVSFYDNKKLFRPSWMDLNSCLCMAAFELYSGILR